MKITLIPILVVFTFLFSFENYAQKTTKESFEETVTPDDLKILLGDWTGTLTYIDYSSNKPFTMPANLRVEQGKNENQLLLFINYPNEPHANSKDKIMISKDGSQLNKIDIKSKERLESGQVRITTEYRAKDNNKEALIRNVYILRKEQFIIRKEVRFEDLNEWLKRNEYNYKR